MQLLVLNLSNLEESSENMDGFDFDANDGKKCVPYVIKWQMAKNRAGTAKTKLMSEVSGSTKKIGFQCKPQAIKVNVAYSDDFSKYFSDCIVSIKTKHMDAPWTMGVAEVGKDLYLQSDAQEEVELAFDIKDKDGDSVSPEGFTNTKLVTVSSQTLLKINISPEVTEVEGGEFGINISVNTDVVDEDVNIEIPSDIFNN